MAFDNNDKSDNISFPEGYEHFADMARAAAETLRALDERIKNIPIEDIKDTVIRLNLDPPALAKAVRNWGTRDFRPALEAQKEEVERALNERMERDIKSWNIDPDTAKQIRLAKIDVLHPNPFAEMSGNELIANRAKQKDQEHSQNYMRSLIRESHTTAKKPEPKLDNEVPQKMKMDVNKLSFAQRYTLKLSFENGSTNSTSTNKPKSRDVDKD